MINKYNDLFYRGQVENFEKWHNWADKMPYIRFKENWDVKIIPPFEGALSRFVVSKGSKSVSVYFDAYSKLGWMVDDNGDSIPYFEAYPIEGDTRRYSLNEVDTMMQDIEATLNDEDNI